jgi:hypothetical protein
MHFLTLIGGGGGCTLAALNADRRLNFANSFITDNEDDVINRYVQYNVNCHITICQLLSPSIKIALNLSFLA